MFFSESFSSRHIGPDAGETAAMLKAVGAKSLEALIDEAIPTRIRLQKPLNLPDGVTEYQFLRDLRQTASRNQIFRSFIGQGYSDCITPSVIVRNVLENPGWYTPYTPYQAEIAQGRLEALLNFQTMVRDLTGMEVANASLLDEATAAAEAMTMLHRVQAKRIDAGVCPAQFFVSDRCFAQTLDVLKARAEPLGIELLIGNFKTAQFGDRVFGALVQTPDEAGCVHDLTDFIARAKRAGVAVAVGTDLLSLTLLTPPGEMGADVVYGNSQRFGVPLGYGGPHAAFFATLEKHVRQAPGRIIGVSIDAHGNTAYRMSLQTREQHIRREKATSNICTAQALLANIAGLYAVYHGPLGLKAIATRVHGYAKLLERELGTLGYRQLNAHYFDTPLFAVPGGVSAVGQIVKAAVASGINLGYRQNDTISVSLDETVDESDIRAIVAAFAAGASAAGVGRVLSPDVGRVLSPDVGRVLSTDVGRVLSDPPDGQPGPKGPGLQGEAGLQLARSTDGLAPTYPMGLARTTPFLTHPVFNTHHSETQMMRYIRSLERKDIGLDTSMIPLGSCTMKLNAASEMLPITWPEFGKIHPFAAVDQTSGYQQIFSELGNMLREITGFAAVSLQPNSGAQGEFAGLMVIRAYFHARGETSRDVVLIPASAHGTNPASAVMAGMRVVVVASTSEGNIDVEDVKKKAEEHADRLATLMVTYPSTHGVFEESIQDICAIVHHYGGQVYMDGANMNAQVGLTSPAVIGADVCHLNLHKTFSIPHGGGGPGVGPIGVAAHLAPYLPGHPTIKTGGDRAIHALSAAPWGSASILLISYAYMKMLGRDGMTDATRYAILNANYLKSRLEPYFPVLYTRPNGRVAHEMIFDLRPLKQASGIDELDVAKRLMDYGFHAPTVSFPVAGTIMVEPTESEAKDELDRFCEAMIAIRAEIQAVIDGKADRTDNVLKNAPHTAGAIAADDWSHPYPREQAVFPLPFVRANKHWPSVGRIDNPYGDRNLMCACPPIEEYEKV
ncbi:MAG: aminomethyl-transferring glycine dehydrogenase subunit GcvPB [Acidobacteria bacterium]|nr:aminomethyl-transferring glycine dehydrogenase subunit GcvPB [Acidobacteriota bacterium]